MGFRTSFYRYSKEYINSIKDMSRDENDYFYPELDDKKGHELMYDAFTNSVLKIYKDSLYASPIFVNEKDSDDYLHIKMNKEQFGNFIKYLLKNYIEYQKEHIINTKEFDKLKDELKDGYNSKSRFCHEYNELPLIDKLISNQCDFNFNVQMYCADLTYFDEILENPWCITKSWNTQMAITNLIHIYHIMNWDKEEIVIRGC